MPPVNPTQQLHGYVCSIDPATCVSDEMMKPLTRRQFLQTAGLAGGAAVLPTAAEAAKDEPALPSLRIEGADAGLSICPYCAVGCGMRVYSRDGKAIHLEGDPEHPINEGALCSKGAAALQLINNERRLTTVLYRAPGASEWQRKSWPWALEQIARRIKTTRDGSFEKEDSDGRLVNRAPAIAHLGGAAHTNEECYVIVKMLRALGLVYLEHQARI